MAYAQADTQRQAFLAKLLQAGCPLPTAHCPLPTAHCPLPTAHYPPPTLHYTAACHSPPRAGACPSRGSSAAPYISPYLPISPVQVHFREQRIEQLAQEKVRVRG